MIARYVRRGAKPSLRRLGPLLASACSVALAAQRHEPIEREADLEKFAQFVRCTSSLRRLLPMREFDALAASLISNDDPEFSHDEFVAFIASQLIAGGLAARPPTHTHKTTLDLRVNGALRTGNALFFECKERNPTARRDPESLLGYLRTELAAARGQLARHAAGTRGIACVDLGLVPEGAEPAEADVVSVFRSKLASGPLIGVLLSSTRLLIAEEDHRFVPAFRSGLYRSRRLASEVKPAVLDGLLRALRFVHRETL